MEKQRTMTGYIIADWIFYSVNVVIAVLLGTFAQAFAGVRWPRYSRLLLAGLVLLPAVGLGVALLCVRRGMVKERYGSWEKATR